MSGGSGLGDKSDTAADRHVEERGRLVTAEEDLDGGVELDVGHPPQGPGGFAQTDVHPR